MAATTNDSATGRRPAVRAAILIGSAMEWYDFYIYAAMAALVFGGVFFPSQNPTAGTLSSLATFAAGFIARPFGGLVFGALGDRLGRKAVLLITFIIMGTASGLIGLLPGFATIGIAAPILLVVLRVIQGFGAGAEYGSAVAVAYEYAGAENKGRMGALPGLGIAIGVFLSSVTVTILTSTSHEFLITWGWRIPFLVSFLLVAVGYWVRRQIPETPDFQAYEKRTTKKAPLRDLFHSDWRGLVIVIALALGFNCVSYVFNTFSLSYLAGIRGVAPNVGSFGATVGAIVALVVIPLAGRLSDRWNARVLLIAGSAAVIVFAFPYFVLLDTSRPAAIWLALGVATGILTPMMLAAQGSFLAAQFPVGVRATGLGLGRDVSSSTK